MRRHIVYPFNLCIDRSFLSLCITSAAVNIKEILRQTYQTYLSGQESIAAMAMGDLPDQVTQPDGISGTICMVLPLFSPASKQAS